MIEDEETRKLVGQAIPLVPHFLNLRSELLSEGYTKDELLSEGYTVMSAMLSAYIASSIETEGRSETAVLLLQASLFVGTDATSN